MVDYGFDTTFEANAAALLVNTTDPAGFEGELPEHRADRALLDADDDHHADPVPGGHGDVLARSLRVVDAPARVVRDAVDAHADQPLAPAGQRQPPGAPARDVARLRDAALARRRLEQQVRPERELRARVLGAVHARRRQRLHAGRHRPGGQGLHRLPNSLRRRDGPGVGGLRPEASTTRARRRSSARRSRRRTRPTTTRRVVDITVDNRPVAEFISQEALRVLLQRHALEPADRRDGGAAARRTPTS